MIEIMKTTEQHRLRETQMLITSSNKKTKASTNSGNHEGMKIIWYFHYLTILLTKNAKIDWQRSSIIVHFERDPSQCLKQQCAANI